MLIVDDHDLFRTGIRNLLEEQGVQISGDALVARTRWSTFAAMPGEMSDSPRHAARMPAISSSIDESFSR